MGDFIAFVILGILAGWLAGVITRSDRSIWGDLLLGLAGAMVAGFVVKGLFDTSGGIVSIPSVIAATVAAVILVLAKNMIMGSRST